MVSKQRIEKCITTPKMGNTIRVCDQQGSNFKFRGLLRNIREMS